MKAVFKLSLKDTYRKVFHILNAFQDKMDVKLTDSEIDLLAEFLILPRKRFEYQPFSTLAKNKVIESVRERGWKLSRENINNKIYSLVIKGYLWRDADSVVYLKPHIKKLVEQLRKSIEIDAKYSFTIEFKLNEDTPKDQTEELQDN
jgi:hypothetical protein